MLEIPDINLIDNPEIEVYGYKYYDTSFLTRLEKTFSEKRNKILTFFRLNDYPKVRINLFDNLSILNDFSSKYIQIFPYHKGDCCGGMINYFCDDLLLCDHIKTGYIISSICHEFVHMIYHDVVKGTPCVWLEEGLATFLSGQKSFFEINVESYINFIEKHILNSELPKIEFLKVRGRKIRTIC